MRWARLARGAAPAAMAVALLGGAAWAETKAPKQNGDAASDLAPLDQSGNSATSGPLATANTPPIGGATQGGGGNPKESGPVDAARAGKAKDTKVQPDNR